MLCGFPRGKAYAYKDGKATETAVPDDSRIDEMRDIFKEAVASADDELLEKFFEGEEFSAEELTRGLSAGVAAGSIFPVFACDGLLTDAVDLLLNGLVAAAPNAAVYAGEEVDGDKLACDENGPLAAICFKTIADPFVGKMSFFKVVSGKITPDAPAYNARTDESERMGKIITIRGSKQEDAAAIPAGDIGVVTKLSGVNTGDTLCSPKKSSPSRRFRSPLRIFPWPLRSAKRARKKRSRPAYPASWKKTPHQLHHQHRNTRAGSLGLGEQHLDVVVSKLKSKFGVEVDLVVPKVAYRETSAKGRSAGAPQKAIGRPRSVRRCVYPL